MSFRFVSIGSGSSGNCMLICADETTLMLDCGFSRKETVRRLGLLDIEPESIDAIIVTHEHQDHLAGVGVFSRKHKTPVWMSYGTAQVDRVGVLHQTHIVDSHQPFTIGNIAVTPYPVPHDAKEPLQFVFSTGKRSLGVFTDAGHTTAHVRKTLSNLDALVIEANHDTQLLMDGTYSQALKKRVAGSYGHLNNHQSAELSYQVNHASLQHLIAAHLSEKNNSPAHVENKYADFFEQLPDGFTISTQENGFNWCVIE